MRALAVTAVAAAWFGPRAADAQVDYRNVDSGRPLRISDATPTARRSLEVSVGNGRLDKLSLNRYRLQLEPRVSYGLLPRTEISVRSPVFFNERAARPRSGVGGVGIGTEHQLVMESQHVPAIALAAEYFVPTGPAAVPSTYAVKAMLTRSSEQSTYITNPKGGVTRPIIKFSTTTTPMCTGLMLPISVSALTNGMKIMMHGTGSMKSPTIVKSSTSRSMIRCGSLPATEVIQSEITMAPRR